MSGMIGRNDGEHESLPTHVNMCLLRYEHIAKELGGIKKILWVVSFILLTGTISTSLAVWLPHAN